MEDEKEEKITELVKKYNINIPKLEEEQKKLSKSLILKDNMDFSLADRIAGVENIFIGNRIISAIVVLYNDEIVEQEYFEDKIRFPYLPGFRAYRELFSMVEAYNKLDEKPDLVFIHGNGILHPRGLGLASHFSLAVNVPTIGIADSCSEKIIGDNILIGNKIFGKVLVTKEGANPIYISQGNLISLNSALELTKKFIKEPHKMPEPLRLAKKYAKEVMSEIGKGV